MATTTTARTPTAVYFGSPIVDGHAAFFARQKTAQSNADRIALLARKFGMTVVESNVDERSGRA